MHEQRGSATGYIKAFRVVTGVRFHTDKCLVTHREKRENSQSARVSLRFRVHDSLVVLFTDLSVGAQSAARGAVCGVFAGSLGAVRNVLEEGGV